ncbi:DUF1489 family protein [Aestuariivirga litoralis]|uniref:DUF1489 family protein n=1 Tax=Aestuariivirga litoralis TaxID=2650924 RepID=UPI0018C7701A|nr:DUF1489 domain-containing protein [Aestuariivirga litoralis]MBG1231358.1 DUF1489 domain-containing protein [Aestuariivirga litoralis]
MTLNLVKLCVGVDEVQDLKDWIKQKYADRETSMHVTRMWPRREADILPGGSLYWVIRGMILCRQQIVGFEKTTGADGIDRCRILMNKKVVLVHPVPRRAFQGWRYLEASDAPPDMKKGSGGGADLSEKMRRELAELGLL